MSWVLPLLVKEVLLGWHGLFIGKKRRKIRRTTPLCLFWAVWKERNKIAFENEEFSIQRLKYIYIFFVIFGLGLSRVWMKGLIL